MIPGNFYKGSTIELRLQTGIILEGADVSIVVKRQEGENITLPGEIVDYTTIAAVLNADDNDVAGLLQLQAKASFPPTAANKITGPGAAFFSNPVNLGDPDAPRYYKVTRNENPSIFSISAYMTAELRAVGTDPAWTAGEQGYAQTPGQVVGMGRPWDLYVAALTQDDVPAEGGLNFDIVATETEVLFGTTEQIMILEPFAEPG